MRMQDSTLNKKYPNNNIIDHDDARLDTQQETPKQQYPHNIILDHYIRRHNTMQRNTLTT
jgi:hypothetical protein